MPSSPDVSLEKIKEDARKIVVDNGGKNREYEEEPVAFGLKAVIVFFEWPEEKNLEEVENALSEIENVSSSQVIDMRRLLE